MSKLEKKDSRLKQEKSVLLDLEPAKNVIRAFLDDIEAVKNIRHKISAPQIATAFSVSDRIPLSTSTQFIPCSGLQAY